MNEDDLDARELIIALRSNVFEGMAILDSTGNICILRKEENGYRAVIVNEKEKP